ncbi:hypothetical protein ACWDKQ_31585, partial [Saccharopolyspora sp. NPDC000995]
MLPVGTVPWCLLSVLEGVRSVFTAPTFATFALVGDRSAGGHGFPDDGDVERGGSGGTVPSRAGAPV